MYTPIKWLHRVRDGRSWRLFLCFSFSLVITIFLAGRFYTITLGTISSPLLHQHRHRHASSPVSIVWFITHIKVNSANFRLRATPSAMLIDLPFVSPWARLLCTDTGDIKWLCDLNKTFTWALELAEASWIRQLHKDKTSETFLDAVHALFIQILWICYPPILKFWMMLWHKLSHKMPSLFHFKACDRDRGRGDKSRWAEDKVRVWCLRGYDNGSLLWLFSNCCDKNKNHFDKSCKNSAPPKFPIHGAKPGVKHHLNRQEFDKSESELQQHTIRMWEYLIKSDAWIPCVLLLLWEAARLKFSNKIMPPQSWMWRGSAKTFSFCRKYWLMNRFLCSTFIFLVT